MPEKKVEKLVLIKLSNNSDRYAVKKRQLATAEVDLTYLKRKDLVLIENLKRQIKNYKLELEACQVRVMTRSRFKLCEN
jgi:hypothetical protein